MAGLLLAPQVLHVGLMFFAYSSLFLHQMQTQMRCQRISGCSLETMGVKAMRCTAYQGRWTDHRYNPYVFGQRGAAAAAYENGGEQLLAEAAEHDRNGKQQEYLNEAYEDGAYQAGANDGEFGQKVSSEQQPIAANVIGNPIAAGRPGAPKQPAQEETAKDGGEEDGEQMFDARQQQDQQSVDGEAGENAWQQAGMDEWQMLGGMAGFGAASRGSDAEFFDSLENISDGYRRWATLNYKSKIPCMPYTCCIAWRHNAL